MGLIREFLNYLDGLSARELILKTVYLIGVLSAAGIHIDYNRYFSGGMNSANFLRSSSSFAR